MFDFSGAHVFVATLKSLGEKMGRDLLQLPPAAGVRQISGLLRPQPYSRRDHLFYRRGAACFAGALQLREEGACRGQ